MTDWSGVPMNAAGAPLGYVNLTPVEPPGAPIYVEASSLSVVLKQDLGALVITSSGRTILTKENIQEVFRRKAEANTVISYASFPPPPPPIIMPEKPDRIRKKS